jgi:hypothetical protein
MGLSELVQKAHVPRVARQGELPCENVIALDMGQVGEWTSLARACAAVVGS